MPEKGKGASKQSGKAIDIDPAQFLLSPDQIDSFARVLQETMAKQPQLLVLIRGVPGMGKSYVAKQLTEKLLDGEGAVHLETDQQFVTGGDYVYDPSKIELAHQNTQTEAKHLMMERAPLLLVSNTFTRFWEMQEYLELAEAYRYHVVVYDLYMQLNANICGALPAERGKTFPLKEELVPFLAGNNEHDVPLDKIKQMIERYEYDAEVVTLDYLSCGRGWAAGRDAAGGSDASATATATGVGDAAAVVPRTLTGVAAQQRSFKVLDFGHCLVLDVTVAEDSAHPFHSSAYRCCIIGCQFLLRCYGMKAGYQMMRKLTQRNAKSHGTYYARVKAAAVTAAAPAAGGGGKGLPPQARGGNYAKHMAGWTRFHITLLSPGEYTKLKKLPPLQQQQAKGSGTAVKAAGGKKMVGGESAAAPASAVDEFVQEAQRLDFGELIRYFDAMLAEQLAKFKEVRNSSSIRNSNSNSNSNSNTAATAPAAAAAAPDTDADADAVGSVASPGGRQEVQKQLQVVLPMGILQGPITDTGSGSSGGGGNARRDDASFVADDFARAAGLSKSYSTAAYLQLHAAPLQAVEQLRSRYSLAAEDWVPHITLGFTHNDVHADASTVLQTMDSVRVRAVRPGSREAQEVPLRELQQSPASDTAMNRKRPQKAAEQGSSAPSNGGAATSGRTVVMEPSADQGPTRADKKNAKRRKKSGTAAAAAAASVDAADAVGGASEADDDVAVAAVAVADDVAANATTAAPGSKMISTGHVPSHMKSSSSSSSSNGAARPLGVRDIGRQNFAALFEFIAAGGLSGCPGSATAAATDLAADDGVSDSHHCSLAELLLYSEVNASFKGAFSWTATAAARSPSDAAVTAAAALMGANDSASKATAAASNTAAGSGTGSGSDKRNNNKKKQRGGGVGKGSDASSSSSSSSRGAAGGGYEAVNHFGFVLCDLKVRRGPMGDDATYRAHNFLQQHLPRGLCYVQHASNACNVYPALFSIRKFYGKEGMEDDGIGINASQMKFKLSRILQNTVQLMITEKINGRAGSCRFFHFMGELFAVVGTKVSHVVVKVDVENQLLLLPPEIERFRTLFSGSAGGGGGGGGGDSGGGGGGKFAGVADYDGNKLIASNAVGLELVLKWSQVEDFARWLGGRTLNGEVLDPAEMHLVTLTKHEWVSLCVTDFSDAVLYPDVAPDSAAAATIAASDSERASAPETDAAAGADASTRVAGDHAVLVMRDLERYVASLPSCDLCRIDLGVDNLSFSSPWDADLLIHIDEPDASAAAAATSSGSGSSLESKKETYNCIADFIVFAHGSEGKVMYYLDRHGRVLELMKYKTWWYVWRRSVREICARMFSYYYDGNSNGGGGKGNKALLERKSALEKQQLSMLGAKKGSQQNEKFAQKMQEVQQQLQEINEQLQASQRGASYNLQPYAVKITQEIRRRWRSKFTFFKNELGDRYEAILSQVINTACAFVEWASAQFALRQDAFFRDFKTKYPMMWTQFLADTGCEDTF